MKSINEYLINKKTQAKFDFFNILQDHNIITTCTKKVNVEEGWDKYELKMLEEGLHKPVYIYIFLRRNLKDFYFTERNSDVFISATASEVEVYKDEKKNGEKVYYNNFYRFDIDKEYGAFVVNKKNTDILIEMLEMARYNNK